MPLDFASFPLREFRKGRGMAWDPQAIDLTQDRDDWLALNEEERYFLLAQVVGFLIGERGVTHDLAPLQQVLRKERGRTAEEMYLAQQLYEEATHVEFFERWTQEVLPGTLGKEIPYPEGTAPFFAETLPEAMNALNEDPSPAAQLRATVVYHQIIEGVLAERGYRMFYHCMDSRSILPGLREGIRNIQIDESRHIAFGTYLAQRLIKENPELEAVFIEEMDKLHDVTVYSARELFDLYDGPVPFNADADQIERIGERFFQDRKEVVLKGGLIEA
jgi:ribonucleoside-diphosphate reductase beta chain